MGLFQVIYPLQFLIPSTLQLRRDKPMIRIDSIILTLCQPRLVARLFELQFPLSALGRQVLQQSLQDVESYLNTHWRDSFQEGFHDRSVYGARGHALANPVYIPVVVTGLADVAGRSLFTQGTILY